MYPFEYIWKIHIFIIASKQRKNMMLLLKYFYFDFFIIDFNINVWEREISTERNFDNMLFKTYHYVK